MASEASAAPGPSADAPQQRAGGKRPFQGGGKFNKKQQKKVRKRERDMKSGTHEEILELDLQALRLSQQSDEAEDAPAAEETLPEEGAEVEVEVVELSSTGEGLAQQKGSKQIYVVPFTVPGDVVKVKAYRHLKEGYTVADFLSVVKPSPKRDDARINCQYFGKCSGCQFQMIDYNEQLRIKKRIVEKAVRNFSELPPELVPAIQDTIGSPLKYGYRTKLTPHFDGPPGWFKGRDAQFESRPPIGFTPKTSRKTMDIEDCPIATDAVRMGLKLERQRMETEFGKYKRGATILLRESTKRLDKTAEPPRSPSPSRRIEVATDTYNDYKTCVTDNKGESTEYVDDFIFQNPANSFFQNNNSILPPFTDYIRQHILPPSSEGAPPIQYLVDAYSGSGLFTITLSSLFKQSIGIDIAGESITYARKNAMANKLPESQTKFIAADANELFQSLDFPPDETVVVLDPPRKGCDANFIKQLLKFAPKRVLYVSCNVHTQARDVGLLVRGETGAAAQGEKSEKSDVRYSIESLRGFDFFPQTGHVEGVAVLNRVDSAAVPAEAPAAES